MIAASETVLSLRSAAGSPSVPLIPSNGIVVKWDLSERLDPVVKLRLEVSRRDPERRGEGSSVA
jgi:hypothetical protein